MFAPRYFAPRYFAPRYFPPGFVVVAITFPQWETPLSVPVVPLVHPIPPLESAPPPFLVSFDSFPDWYTPFSVPVLPVVPITIVAQEAIPSYVPLFPEDITVDKWYSPFSQPVFPEPIELLRYAAIESIEFDALFVTEFEPGGASGLRPIQLFYQFTSEPPWDVITDPEPIDIDKWYSPFSVPVLPVEPLVDGKMNFDAVLLNPDLHTPAFAPKRRSMLAGGMWRHGF